MKLYLFPVRGVKSIRAVSLEDAIAQYKELLKQPKTQIKVIHNEEDIKAFLSAYPKEK